MGEGEYRQFQRVTGVSHQTVYNGLKDLNQKIKNDGRVRGLGGGRKKTTNKNPEIITFLEEILESNTRGDPEAPLKWTCKSVRNLSDELKKKKVLVGRQTIANILHELDYSLQSNRKASEGKEDHGPPPKNRTPF